MIAVDAGTTLVRRAIAVGVIPDEGARIFAGRDDAAGTPVSRPAQLDAAPAELRGWEWQHLQSRLVRGMLAGIVEDRGLASIFS